MLAKIKHLLGIRLCKKPLKRVGPFERAAADVAEMEALQRAKWEEREKAWLARSRVLQGQKTNMEIASGMVIDPGGTCLCRRCGHTVSAVSDRCQQCFNALNWNA